MQLELKTIQEEVGLTFLHVTHDQEEAMTMADTVAVMNKGSIEQMGAPEELYELPRTAFVANFLGKSNLFTGDVVETTSTSVSVDAGGHRITVPTSRAQRHQGLVTVGVRPEKVALHLEAPPATSERNVLGPGRVIDVSFAGVSTVHIVTVPGVGTMSCSHRTWASARSRRGCGGVAELGRRARLRTRGRADESSRFPADDDTRSIALQRREALISELEGS